MSSLEVTMMKRIGELKAENARLKAEVERLTLENSQYEEHHKYGQNVIISLREDVERLKEGNECLDQMHEKEMARSAFLCEQVERLTKAGDAVCESPYLWETDPAVIAWRAAKEGKQP
jgi:predicted nuclease with TOPRIM domain